MRLVGELTQFIMTVEVQLVQRLRHLIILPVVTLVVDFSRNGGIYAVTLPTSVVSIFMVRKIWRRKVRFFRLPFILLEGIMAKYINGHASTQHMAESVSILSYYFLVLRY